jgi:hypothetical protein
MTLRETFTVTTPDETVYAVEQEIAAGTTKYFLFADTPTGREFARHLWLMLMGEAWTAAVTRGPKPLGEIATAFEAGVTVIDCR